jgi:hypothetical protein
MRTLILLSLSVVVAVALIGCGGSKSMQAADTGDVPEWFTNVPSDPNFLFAANTGTSQDLQLAIDKAATGGRAEIGRQVEVRVNALQKRFDEEVGLGSDAQLLQQFTQASKTVVSTSLMGSRISKQKQVKDGDLWRAYVLIEYPIGAANAALVDQIKKNNEMYTRFRASQTFKELDEEVQKYEEWKKQQGTP